MVATNGSSGAPQIIKRSYEEASVELGEALSRLNKLDAVGTTNDGPTANMVIRSKPKRRCILMPAAKTSRLFGRLDIFVQLEELLTADAGEFSLQSVALHGLGGVGKAA